MRGADRYRLWPAVPIGVGHGLHSPKGRRGAEHYYASYRNLLDAAQIVAQPIVFGGNREVITAL